MHSLQEHLCERQVECGVQTDLSSKNKGTQWDKIDAAKALKKMTPWRPAGNLARHTGGTRRSGGGGAWPPPRKPRASSLANGTMRLRRGRRLSRRPRPRLASPPVASSRMEPCTGPAMHLGGSVRGFHGRDIHGSFEAPHSQVSLRGHHGGFVRGPSRPERHLSLQPVILRSHSQDSGPESEEELTSSWSRRSAYYPCKAEYGTLLPSQQQVIRAPNWARHGPADYPQDYHPSCYGGWDPSARELLSMLNFGPSSPYQYVY